MMQPPNYIRALKMNITTHVLPPELTEGLHPRGPKWFGRLIFYLALRIKAIEWKTVTQEVVTYGPLDDTRLGDAILSCIHDAGMRGEHVRNKTLIIGSAEWQSLLSQPGPEQMIEFAFTGLRTRENDIDRFLGVQVRVVPWLVGWAIV